MHATPKEESRSTDGRWALGDVTTDLGRPGDLIAAFSRETAREMPIFGDSVMQRLSRHDGVRRTLGEMIAAALAGRSGRAKLARRVAALVGLPD